MNLDEIRFYRKLLKLQKSFCCALALTALLSLPSGSCKRNNSNNISMSSSISLDKSSRDMLLDSVSMPIRRAIVSYKTCQALNYVGNAVVNNVGMALDYIHSMCELSYPEKMQVIMEREKLTYDELDECIAGMIAESCEDGNNYGECYRTMSTLFNRIHSISMVDYVSDLKKGADGSRLICQFEAKNQFSVYAHRSYEEYLGRIDLKGYQACIDMLYSGIPSHNYIQFNNVPPKDGIPLDQYIDGQSNGTPYEHFYDNGNYYYTELKENDRIPNEAMDNRVIMNDEMKRVLGRN